MQVQGWTFGSGHGNATRSLSSALIFALLLVILSLFSSAAHAQKGAFGGPSGEPIEEVPNVLPAQVRGLDIAEHLGAPLPMELTFTRSNGQPVTLGEYFKGDKPAVILLVYYKCPMVCDVVMHKTVETLDEIDLTAGKDYNLLVFSFDPRETAADAAEARKNQLESYRRPLPGDKGFEFHANLDSSTAHLADALGFKYRKMANGDYSHPVAQFIVTPDGRVSRYFYGFKQDSKDMKLALMEASQGKLVKTIGERVQNFCYLFDPSVGKYTLQVMRVMQIAGIVTLAALTLLIGGLFGGEYLRRRRAAKRAIKVAQATLAPEETIERIIIPDATGSTRPGPGGLQGTQVNA